MSNDTELKDIRARIDSIDERLVGLISERAAIVAEVAKIKRNDENNVSFYRPEREAQILQRS